MSDHPIRGLMDTAMQSIKAMVDVNTIVGDPVETADGTVIIPVSKVTFGFAAGGSEFGEAKQNKESGANSMFGGGSGAGVTIVPVAFLVVGNGTVRLIPMDANSPVERLIDYVPGVVDKVFSIFSKDKEEE